MKQKTILLSGLLSLCPAIGLFAQNKVSIEIKPTENKEYISPNIYGQFIEYLGKSITGGIFEENSPLSDENGFRMDVMEKVKKLQTPNIRYPGGTVSKIYHWEDGIGPIPERKARKNLIWGGVEDNHFGTDEYIKYCRAVGAEPFIVVNMGTGTAEEAANWVEYCNGTGNTYYANLRRKNGSEAPYNVKYWSLGNEEAAREDAGRLFKPEKYAEESWLFVKLMKLTDPSIQLFFVGDLYNYKWNDAVLDELSPVCDYLSVHWYVGSDEKDNDAIYDRVNGLDDCLKTLSQYLTKYPDKVEHFLPWYRFDPRREPIKISVDEWGIWDRKCGGKWGHDCNYTWQDALVTASFLNVFHRHAGKVKMANWAQMVNVLGAINADETSSVEQTVYYPLMYFREHVGNIRMDAIVDAPEMIQGKKIPVLDLSASYNEEKKQIALFAVNRNDSKAYDLDIQIPDYKIGTINTICMTAENEQVFNTIGGKNAVKITEQKDVNEQKLKIPASAIMIVLVDVK